VSATGSIKPNSAASTVVSRSRSTRTTAGSPAGCNFSQEQTGVSVGLGARSSFEEQQERTEVFFFAQHGGSFFAEAAAAWVRSQQQLANNDFGVAIMMMMAISSSLRQWVERIDMNDIQHCLGSISRHGGEMSRLP